MTARARVSRPMPRSPPPASSVPLLDLPALGVATFGQGKMPALTPLWESATLPGDLLRRHHHAGAAGLKKHGIPANSGALHGYRYNARVLARHRPDPVRGRAGTAAGRDRRGGGVHRDGAGRGARSLPSARLPGSCPHGRSGRRVPRRGRHAPDSVPRRDRTVGACGDARGRWVRRESTRWSTRAWMGASRSTRSRPIRSWASRWPMGCGSSPSSWDASRAPEPPDPIPDVRYERRGADLEWPLDAPLADGRLRKPVGDVVARRGHETGRVPRGLRGRPFREPRRGCACPRRG